MDIASSPRKNPFLFEFFWLNHPEFHENHHQWWEEVAIFHGSLMYQFQQRLKFFKMSLEIWNKTIFGNIFHAQQVLEQRMKSIQEEIIYKGLTM